MHDDKIWGLDVKGEMMITGGGDSSIKIWKDFTEEQELLDQERDLQKFE